MLHLGDAAQRGNHSGHTGVCAVGGVVERLGVVVPARDDVGGLIVSCLVIPNRYKILRLSPPAQ